MLAGYSRDVSGTPPRTLIQPYDAESVTEITTVPGVPTDIELAPEEKITGLALGDTIQWRVEELPGHLFIKPLHTGLFTAATLVTNQRVYPLVLHSTNTTGAWLLRVRWTIPPAIPQHSANPPPIALIPTPRNRDYTIEGEAEFRPKAVFDDGHFTWIDMGQPQVLPALFMVGPDGPQLINYLLHSPYFVVQRLMPRFLLKLGKTEVTITNRAYGNPSHE
jgi:Type IV secretory pathway, VirB9 components